MKRNNFVVYGVSIIVAAALSLGSCAKKESESTTEEKDSESPAMRVDNLTGEKRDEAGKKPSPKKESRDRRDLKRPFMAPMDAAKDRFLEYVINLTYECESFMKSRQRLLDISGRYGFINSSDADTDDSTQLMNVSLHVRARALYDALRELDDLGMLVSEKISVVDHTEAMVLAQKKIRREQLRISRKSRAIGGMAPEVKYWKEREDSLERSENESDTQEHEQWKINDKVSWAKIHLTLKGPDVPSRIEVPLYRNALVGMVNLLLNIIYLLLWLAPLIIIAGFVLWKRKIVLNLLSKRREKKKQAPHRR